MLMVLVPYPNGTASLDKPQTEELLEAEWGRVIY